MASLSSGLKLGSGSASSLLKSASSIQRQVTDYQDALAAYEYANSAYTDTAYEKYAKYLNDRINSLGSAGGLSNAQKALTMTKTLESATKSNISSSITRENIQIMAGNATKQDKYNLISQQYVRAVGNGDLTLAQSLESQAYNLSQQMQYEAQQAASAAKTLGESNASNQASVAGNLEDSLKQLNNDVKTVGEANFQKTVDAWVKTNKDTLAKLGVHLPDGATFNYFNVVQAVGGAMYNAYGLAAKAEAPYDPSKAQQYRQKALNINNGIDTLPTLAGNMTINDIQQAMNTPNRFVFNPNSGKLEETKIANYSSTLQTDAQGKVIGVGPRANYTGSVQQTVFLTPTQTAEMSNLGLVFSKNNDGTTGNGVKVYASDKTPDWLKKTMGTNGVEYNMYTDQQGNLQFTSSASEGPGKSVFTVAKDTRGLRGLYEQSPTGDKLVGGDYGYNPYPSQGDAHTSFLNRVAGNFKGMLAGGLGGMMSLFGGHASALSPSDLVSGSTQLQLAQANAKAAQLMLAQAPPQLPQLSFAAPTPQPSLSLAPAPPTTRSVAQQTVNPQPTAPSTTIQNTQSGISLQGGGRFRLQ